MLDLHITRPGMTVPASLGLSYSKVRSTCFFSVAGCAFSHQQPPALTGTAVYIYGIDVLNPANVTFAMSNPSIASFHFYSGSGYVYNSLFFSATQLDPSVQHTVTWLMETSSVGGGAALFDYAKVTISQADVSSSSASTSPSTPSSTSCVPICSPIDISFDPQRP